MGDGKMDATSPRIVERYKNLRFRETPGDSVRIPDGGCLADASGFRCRTAEADGDNPLCGDVLHVRLLVRESPCGPVIDRARFGGYGCSLCLASADVLMECVEGMDVESAREFDVDDLKRALGGLEVGRSREDCVSLSVDVLHRALEEEL